MKSELKTEKDRLPTLPPGATDNSLPDDATQAEKNLEQIRIKLKILQEYMEGNANPLLDPKEIGRRDTSANMKREKKIKEEK